MIMLEVRLLENKSDNILGIFCEDMECGYYDRSRDLLELEEPLTLDELNNLTCLLNNQCEYVPEEDCATFGEGYNPLREV